MSNELFYQGVVLCVLNVGAGYWNLVNFSSMPTWLIVVGLGNVIMASVIFYTLVTK